MPEDLDIPFRVQGKLVNQRRIGGAGFFYATNIKGMRGTKSRPGSKLMRKMTEIPSTTPPPLPELSINNVKLKHAMTYDDRSAHHTPLKQNHS